VRVASLLIGLVVGLVCLALPVRAVARPRPKIAVAPLAGDAGNKVGEAVAEALAGKERAVVGPRETGREITRLGLPDELDARATRKLATKLGAVAVIDGKVGKAGGKRSLHLEVHRRGKPDGGFSIEFKSTASRAFRRAVRDEIDKKLEGAGDDPAGDDEPRPAAVADDGEARRKADDDAQRARKRSDDDDAAARQRKLADDDAAARKRRPAAEARKAKRVAAADDDDGDAAVRKRKRARPGDEAAPQIVARVGAGGSVAQRQLSWDVRSGFTQVPPRVLTTAGAGRVDGELYPFALADPHSGLAALGLAAAYDKTFGLSIKVPNQTLTAPISQSHYAVGVRYRLGIGDESSLALGLDYAHRQYIADRSGLMAAVLDAPDVEYAAVSPGAWLRVPVTSSVAVFGGGDGLFIFDAGGIQKSTSYGPATVYGIEAGAGVDVALTPQIGLRFALEYSQIMFKFTAKGSTLANNRDGDPSSLDVNGATDRSIGGTVMACLIY
jgi:hypothetical protein